MHTDGCRCGQSLHFGVAACFDLNLQTSQNIKKQFWIELCVINIHKWYQRPSVGCEAAAPETCRRQIEKDVPRPAHGTWAQHQRESSWKFKGPHLIAIYHNWWSALISGIVPLSRIKSYWIVSNHGTLPIFDIRIAFLGQGLAIWTRSSALPWEEFSWDSQSCGPRRPQRCAALGPTFEIQQKVFLTFSYGLTEPFALQQNPPKTSKSDVPRAPFSVPSCCVHNISRCQGNFSRLSSP